jgi:hypothetical protein
MRYSTFASLTLLLVAGPAAVSGQSAPGPIADNTEFRVKLLAPLSTETNRKGDKIAAQILDPVPFVGAVMEGEVKESKSGGKISGKSVLNFTFQTIVVGDVTIPVKSEVKSLFNSRHQQNVDEEGRVIEKKNNLGKAAAVTGVGALIGGIAGGAKGAAVGAGAGAAASLIFIEVGTKGANVTFAAGSEMVLSVGERRQTGQ